MASEVEGKAHLKINKKNCKFDLEMSVEIIVKNL